MMMMIRPHHSRPRRWCEVDMNRSVVLEWSRPWTSSDSTRCLRLDRWLVSRGPRWERCYCHGGADRPTWHAVDWIDVSRLDQKVNQLRAWLGVIRDGTHRGEGGLHRNRITCVHLEKRLLNGSSTGCYSSLMVKVEQSVRCMRVCVRAITFEVDDLWSRYLACWFNFTLSTSR